MSHYEYQIIQMVSGGRVTHLNERMENMVAEGWEPIMMSGDTGVTVMMRRERAQQAAGEAQGEAAAAAPRPSAAPQPAGVAPGSH